MSVIRLLIADDDSRFLALMSELIAHEPNLLLVGVAEDGDAAIVQSARTRPDIVLMDVEMPGLSGLAAARRLSSRGDVPQIIMLTMFDSEDSVIQAARIGVAGFLLKNSPIPEILRAIRVVHSGHALLSPESAQHLLHHLGGFRNELPGPESDLRYLTRRERETLTLIGRGRTDAEIARSLFVTVTTVRTYVSRILVKVTARNRSELVVLAYESGLLIPGDSSAT